MVMKHGQTVCRDNVGMNKVLEVDGCDGFRDDVQSYGTRTIPTMEHVYNRKGKMCKTSRYIVNQSAPLAGRKVYIIFDSVN